MKTDQDVLEDQQRLLYSAGESYRELLLALKDNLDLMQYKLIVDNSPRGHGCPTAHRALKSLVIPDLDAIMVNHEKLRQIIHELAEIESFL